MVREAGSPYAPGSEATTEAMLEVLGVEDVEALFDVPPPVRFDGAFGIESGSERAVTREVTRMLERNDDLVEFLGRGHYDHYVPAIADELASRSEFLTSYTQYQPEIAQGFLQALFEYQSLLVELTGLDVANCSVYDAATALGEAARLATRARSTSGDRVLVPAQLRAGKRAVLENYAAGPDLAVESYPMDDGAIDREALAAQVDDDVVMVYAESPTVRGVIEPGLAAAGVLADEHDALFCVGTDVLALALIEEPAAAGADVVVGDASALGTGTAYGTGLGLFATTEEYLRQVPGRLVGAAEDATGRRAFTLTLQTREQHIRRERATSNVCTNQAWLALRTAIHAAWLGPEGLVETASSCVTHAETLADRLDDIDGVTAPVHDRHHFREFAVRVPEPAKEVRRALADEGFAVHAIAEDLLQVCVTETRTEAMDPLVGAFRGVCA
jgi:glycine dehydrogenase subunit 1